MTAEEYEAAFHGIDLPESLQLDSGVFIPDVRAFLERELFILKNNSATRTAEPIKYRLNKVLAMINASHTD